MTDPEILLRVATLLRDVIGSKACRQEIACLEEVASRLSQKSTWVDFNVNDPVRVQLTRLGARLLHKRRQELGPDHVGFPEPDARGWCELQAWEFMRIFGPHLHMSGPLLFQTLIQVQIQVTQK